MKHLLFAYGTLKKGHTRQKFLMDQRYLGTATLKPSHRMVVLSGFPALVALKDGEEGTDVRGEIYEVTTDCIQEVDKVEGVGSNLFARCTLELESYIPMMLPTDHGVFDLLEKGEVEAYVYCREVGHSRDAGCFWF